MRTILCLAVAGVVVLAVGCSQENPLTAPNDGLESIHADKNGTETLGAPSIAIASGTGFAEGGAGLTGASSAELTVDVPAGETIQQVLLYWAGGASADNADSTIVLNGTEVPGSQIGGSTNYYYSGGFSYSFTAFRADITELGIIHNGSNTVTISGLDFDPTVGARDEDNGCSILVITDDGGAAELSLRDGLDLACYGFQPPLESTEPQVFTVTPAQVDRMADLLLIVGDVDTATPARIVITTSQGDQVIDNVLASSDGQAWDSLVLPVQIPAGDTTLAVELISLPDGSSKGGSLAWVSAGLAVAAPPAELEDISGTVYVDADQDGLQGLYELGIANVVVDVSDASGYLTSVVTAADGTYQFSLPGGSYRHNDFPAESGCPPALSWVSL